MGYFSNGTECDGYIEAYCANCLHNGDNDGPSCPVWALQIKYNKAAHGSFLHHLIPLNEDTLDNERCLMFVAKEGRQ